MTRAEIEQEIERVYKRLEELQRDGDQACSANDLRLGYNAEFNIDLANNHIIFYTRELAKFPLTLF